MPRKLGASPFTTLAPLPRKDASLRMGKKGKGKPKKLPPLKPGEIQSFIRWRETRAKEVAKKWEDFQRRLLEVIPPEKQCVSDCFNLFSLITALLAQGKAFAQRSKLLCPDLKTYKKEFAHLREGWKGVVRFKFRQEEDWVLVSLKLL